MSEWFKENGLNPFESRKGFRAFESLRFRQQQSGQMGERLKPADCKSAATSLNAQVQILLCPPFFDHSGRAYGLPKGKHGVRFIGV